MKEHSFYLGSTVVAIKDAPLVVSSHFGKNIRAYKRGDKFKVLSYSTPPLQLVIWHKLIDSTMIVDGSNFELLETYRNDIIDNIL